MGRRKGTAIFLPGASGPIFEKVLRNRGRGRAAFGRFCKGKLQRAHRDLCSGAWEPPAAKSSSDVSISLTTWRKRLGDLPLVLCSLIQQSVQPSNIFVWVSQADYTRLTDRHFIFGRYNVHFRICDDLGPHTKWLPMLESGYTEIFAICDDDIIYPRTWFETLTSEIRTDAYVGLRAHRISRNPDQTISPYVQWEKQVTYSGAPSVDLFITACGGAVIHPVWIAPEFRQRRHILKYAPKQDDVWLNAMHSSIGKHPYKSKYSFPCLELPGSASVGLARTNVEGGENDWQIRGTYTFLSGVRG
jgi:hypothetical protein